MSTRYEDPTPESIVVGRNEGPRATAPVIAPVAAFIAGAVAGRAAVSLSGLIIDEAPAQLTLQHVAGIERMDLRPCERWAPRMGENGYAQLLTEVSAVPQDQPLRTEFSKAGRRRDARGRFAKHARRGGAVQ